MTQVCGVCTGEVSNIAQPLDFLSQGLNFQRLKPIGGKCITANNYYVQ